MPNPTDTMNKPEAKEKASRAEQAAIVAGLQTVLESDEQMLAFSRGKIAGGWRGKFAVGLEAFFAPDVNVGLTERRFILQHIHVTNKTPSEILPHFFALADIASIAYGDIETFGGEPAGRLVMRLQDEQHFRVRLAGKQNCEDARALAEVFRSLTLARRKSGMSPTQSACPQCGHVLDQPFKFCPYCGKDIAAQSPPPSPPAPTTPPFPPDFDDGDDDDDGNPVMPVPPPPPVAPQPLPPDFGMEPGMPLPPDLSDPYPAPPPYSANGTEHSETPDDEVSAMPRDRKDAEDSNEDQFMPEFPIAPAPPAPPAAFHAPQPIAEEEIEAEPFPEFPISGEPAAPPVPPLNAEPFDESASEEKMPPAPPIPPVPSLGTNGSAFAFTTAQSIDAAHTLPEPEENAAMPATTAFWREFARISGVPTPEVFSHSAQTKSDTENRDTPEAREEKE